IVRHAEVAAPAMGYTKGIELGPYLTHLPEQACSGPLLVQFPRGCSTSEDDARSIGRQPEIGQAAFGIGEHPSARTELAREIGGQGLRGNDVTGGGNHARLQERLRVSAVSVGRHEHGPCRNQTALRRHEIVASSPLYAKDRSARNEIDTMAACE